MAKQNNRKEDTWDMKEIEALNPFATGNIDMAMLEKQNQAMEKKLRQMQRELNSDWQDTRMKKTADEEIIIPGSRVRIWGADFSYYNKYGHDDYKNGISMISTKLKTVNRAAKKEIRRRHPDDHFDDDCFGVRSNGALVALDLYPDGGGCVLNMEVRQLSLQEFQHESKEILRQFIKDHSLVLGAAFPFVQLESLPKTQLVELAMQTVKEIDKHDGEDEEVAEDEGGDADEEEDDDDDDDDDDGEEEEADMADKQPANTGAAPVNSKQNASTKVDTDDESWKLWTNSGDIQVWGHDHFIYNKYETKRPKYNDIKVITTDLKIAERAAGKRYIENKDDINDFDYHGGAYLSSDAVVKISLNQLVGLNPVLLKNFLKENKQYLADDGVSDEMIQNAPRSELIKMAWRAPRLLWGRIDTDPMLAARQEEYSWLSVEWMEDDEKKRAAKKAGLVIEGDSDDDDDNDDEDENEDEEEEDDDEEDEDDQEEDDDDEEEGDDEDDDGDDMMEMMMSESEGYVRAPINRRDPKTMPCVAYANGACSKGDACRFSHSES